MPAGDTSRAETRPGDETDVANDHSVEDADVGEPGPPCLADSDEDGFGRFDNCPTTSNPDQKDSDADGIGDACDNCPKTANFNQVDSDGNGEGDTCQGSKSPYNTDSDGDGIVDRRDNCPTESNRDQSDRDGDGIGDVCDNCSDTPNPNQHDNDGDDSGDVCQKRPVAPTCARQSTTLQSETCIVDFEGLSSSVTPELVWIRVGNSWVHPADFKFIEADDDIELLGAVCQRAKRLVSSSGGIEIELVASCRPLCVKSEEICDWKDNDCDGQVDERCYRCRAEICDGKDNDCDGSIDEKCKCRRTGDGCSRGECCAGFCEGQVCNSCLVVGEGPCGADGDCCDDSICAGDVRDQAICGGTCRERR